MTCWALKSQFYKNHIQPPMDSQARIILHKISEIKPSTRDTAQHRAEGAFKFYLQQKMRVFQLELKRYFF